MVGAVPILYFREMIRKYYESNKRSKSVEMLNYFRLLLVTGHFRVTARVFFKAKYRAIGMKMVFVGSCKENSLSVK